MAPPNPRKPLKFKIKPVPNSTDEEWFEVRSRVADAIVEILKDVYQAPVKSFYPAGQHGPRRPYGDDP